MAMVKGQRGTTEVVESERLICSDIAKNNNKIWHIDLHKNGDITIEFGAVDTTLNVGVHFGAGKDKFDSLVRSKLGHRSGKVPYTRQRTLGNGSVKTKQVANTSLKDIATTQITHSNPHVAKLISFLTDANIHAITSNTQITYDAATGDFSTPYGLVEASAITEARNLLTTIGDRVSKKDWESAKMLDAMNNFLRLIPQKIKRDNRRRRLDVQSFIPNLSEVRKQNDLLDALDASLQKAATPSTKSKGKKKEKVEQVFDVQLDLVDDGKIIDQVRRKYRKDKGSHYDVATLDVKQVFKVRINTVHDAFVKHGKKIGNVQQLYHGLKCSSLLSVLKSGLIIVPASSPHVTGRMWADGVYMSSNASKSLRYATNAWTGGGRTDRTFMLLCNAALGKQHIPRGSSWNYRLPSGYDSCYAKPGVSGVQNPEQVVYNTEQIDLIYLIEFSQHGK